MPENYVASLLKSDPSVLFITGAGVSAESGIPTYRGVAGLYNGKDTDLGIPIEDVMSGQTWRTRPDITWRYLRKIGDIRNTVQPNEAHKAIAALEQRLTRVWVLTQNVDGLHQKAGSKKVISIHGNANELMCLACGWEETVQDYSGLSGDVPKCPECGQGIRPQVVLFGESLPDKATHRYNREVEGRGFDVIISVGTTHVFPYINQPVIDAYHAGKPTILVNPDDVSFHDWFATGDEPASYFREHYCMGAVQFFTELMENL